MYSALATANAAYDSFDSSDPLNGVCGEIFEQDYVLLYKGAEGSDSTGKLFHNNELIREFIVFHGVFLQNQSHHKQGYCLTPGFLRATTDSINDNKKNIYNMLHFSPIMSSYRQHKLQLEFTCIIRLELNIIY
nr:hypothetical protein Iba_chr12bCG15290 [Ipomoea batatas]